MHRFLERLTLRVPAREAASVISGHACELKVLVGYAWITVSGDTRDYWLRAGESIRIPASRQVVIEAEGKLVAVELVRQAEIGAFSCRRDDLYAYWLSRLLGLLGRGALQRSAI